MGAGAGAGAAWYTGAGRGAGALGAAGGSGGGSGAGAAAGAGAGAGGWVVRCSVVEGAGELAADCSMTTFGGAFFVYWKEMTCAAAAAPVPTQRVVATAKATVLRGSMWRRLPSATLRRRKGPSKSRWRAVDQGVCTHHHESDASPAT